MTMGSPTRPTGFDDTPEGRWLEALHQRALAAAEYLGLPLDKVYGNSVTITEDRHAVSSVRWEATASLRARHADTRHTQTSDLDGPVVWRSEAVLSFPSGKAMLEAIGPKPDRPPHPMAGNAADD